MLISMAPLLYSYLLTWLLTGAVHALLECSSRVITNYNKTNATNMETNLMWCSTMMKNHHVIPQKSFGSLSRPDQINWDRFLCNELVTRRKYLSCEETLGFTFFSSWRQDFTPTIQGGSEVSCGASALGHVACHFKRVILDFSLCSIHGSARRFETGFFQTYGQLHSGNANTFMRGHQHSNGNYDSSSCDIIETQPVFLISHDDIFNYGHHLNDVFNVWATSKLAFHPQEKRLNSSDWKLLIFDAYRTGGPAGSGRLMDIRDPDALGPFVDLYKSLFGSIIRAVDYSTKKVCFSELYIPSQHAWVWNDWTAENTCSKRGPSPLWQRFNAEIRDALSRLYGFKSQDELPAPDPLMVEIVLLQRKGVPKRGSGARVIANVDKLVAMLKGIGSHVHVTVVDFAGMPFRQQYLAMQSANIFISMHGAGGIHVTNMRVGFPNCCASLELFPPPSIGYASIHGHGNIARWSGVRYYRYVAAEGQGDESSGTKVDLNEIERIVRSAIKTIARSPSCI